MKSFAEIVAQHKPAALNLTLADADNGFLLEDVDSIEDMISKAVGFHSAHFKMQTLR
jgi:hypothetical protein